MKVIVTGATGFFGPAIVQRLREAGHVVVPASRTPSGDGAVLDIRDAATCQAIFADHPGVEAVVHAAALAHAAAGVAEVRAINVEGTRNIAEAAAAAGVSRFVFISSVTVYGEHDLAVPVTESAPSHDTGVYGSAKRDAEVIVDALRDRFERWTLRMATMYSGDWLLNIRKRIAPPIVGRYVHFTLDPRRRRYSLCSRRNGAEAVLWAIERRMPPDVYNVSDDYVYSQEEILHAVERVEGRKPRVPIPMTLPRIAARIAGVGPSALRSAVRGRYWKFCEHNVYASDRIASFGLSLPPHLPGVEGAR